MLVYILFVIGIFLLLKGADYLVDGSSSLAKKLGVPTLVIGLTVVAFGTSMPELVVNVFAAIGGSTDIALGNIVGSNISNILLILGVTAIICALKVQRSTVWKEIPFSLLAAIVLVIMASAFFLDGIVLDSIMRFEGLILLAFFIIYMYYAFELYRSNKSQMEDGVQIKSMSSLRIFLLIAAGLVGLYLGGKWTVEGAVAIARVFGWSEYIISLTIVAIGTSLPELVTSVVAALKKDVDLAVGNVVGSNIFNIFWILGVTSLIAPISIPKFAMIDISILLMATFLLFIFMFIHKKHELERWQGAVFVVLYVAYIVSLFFR